MWVYRFYADRDGHKVTMLVSGKELVEPELEGPHNVRNQECIYKTSPNFSYILETKVKDITGGKVTYSDSAGKEKSVQADSIVLWSGLKPGWTRPGSPGIEMERHRPQSTSDFCAEELDYGPGRATQESGKQGTGTLYPCFG